MNETGVAELESAEAPASSPAGAVRVPGVGGALVPRVRRAADLSAEEVSSILHAWDKDSRIARFVSIAGPSLVYLLVITLFPRGRGDVDPLPALVQFGGFALVYATMAFSRHTLLKRFLRDRGFSSELTRSVLKRLKTALMTSLDEKSVLKALEDQATAETSEKGFTLIEVGIALLLLSLALAVAIPSLNALTGARVKESTGKITGLIRDTYSRSALTGKNHRVVFDLDAHTYWVEVTDGAAVIKRNPLEVDEGKGDIDTLDERLEGLDADDPEDAEKLRLWGAPTWAPVDDELGKPMKLPNDVFFHSVWTEHHEDRVNGGTAALLFFKGGTTEEAHIALTDDRGSDDVLLLVTNPLTGEVYIERDLIEVPR